MPNTVFLAGASGVVGQLVIPFLVSDGWRVVGTTTSPEKASVLQSLGAEPVVIDVYDAAALEAAVVEAGPMVVMHQLTSLPDKLDPTQMPAARPRNARIRDEGTRNLIAAAVAAKASRLVAQSVAFAYAPGPTPHKETDPLDETHWGVVSLERQVLAAPMNALVLRYGHFYGPGTGFERPTAPGSVHVRAAANAARLAARRGVPGIYNIAEDDGAVTVARAELDLGWRATT